MLRLTLISGLVLTFVGCIARSSVATVAFKQSSEADRIEKNGALQLYFPSSKDSNKCDRFEEYAKKRGVIVLGIVNLGSTDLVMTKTRKAARALIDQFKRDTGIDLTSYVSPDWVPFRLDRPMSGQEFLRDRAATGMRSFIVRWALHHSLLSTTDRMVEIFYGDQPGKRVCGIYTLKREFRFSLYGAKYY